MEVTLLQIALILGSGVIAGFVNTIAGGGSFLTLAALEFAGLPILVANGTNRVAVEVQNIMAVAGFRSKGVSDFRQSLHFAVPALVGAILGAYFVTNLDKTIFYRIMGVAMLMMLAILILNPQKWLHGREVIFTPGRRILSYVVFLAIGFYGGAIQAGVGFLLIAALVLVAGLDLVRTNSHKVFIVGTYTLFALLTLALRGQVNWILGFVLAVGNGVGAWIAARMSVERGDRFVRVALGVILAVLSLRYLGIVKF
ncbi:MAG: sulfite exporter TauE/SafE family protein [Chloroflexi bacterium]|nr:sulfite exporter TauE/SafE family protein [Chloroflexota bacterium]